MMKSEQNQKGHGALYVIAAPSGAGKTSLVKRLIETTPDITVSVSHTTRQARPGEVHGKHYYFVPKAEFTALRDQGAFLEHAQVFDHYYGTARQLVDETLAKGVDVVLEIDWQGAQQVRKQYPGCCGIFILPPSRQILQERLTARGQDDSKVIARRMQDAVSEISHYQEFDYLIVNDNFDEALSQLQAVIVARRLRIQVQSQRQERLLQQLLQ